MSSEPEPIPVTSATNASLRLRGLGTLVTFVVAGLAVLFVAAAGVAGIWRAVNPATSSAAAAAPASSSTGASAAAPKVVQVKLVVDPPPLIGVKAPTGKVVDAFVPATFTMTVGTTYDVTVTNYDYMPHTWTSPSLNVNAQIPSGSASKPSVTHFTISPTKAGTFSWFCATPCDAWSMTHNGYMRGDVTVKA